MNSGDWVMNCDRGDLFNKRISLLDGDGFVSLVDCMGSDAAIVQAARVSCGAGTKSVSDDESLIRYLMRHNHGTPFEMGELKFMVRVPMDTWRQWIRHRTASVNEVSSRYSIVKDSALLTEASEWRKQATINKQGSDGYLDVEQGLILSDREKELQRGMFDFYNLAISQGVAREQARKDLPLCTYTEAYWKIDLRNMFHFLELRLDSHAQFEIREYASAIFSIVKKLFPVSSKAFEDYKLHSVTFSDLDKNVLRKLLIEYRDKDIHASLDEYVSIYDKSLDPHTGEAREFKSKIIDILECNNTCFDLVLVGFNNFASCEDWDKCGGDDLIREYRVKVPQYLKYYGLILHKRDYEAMLHKALQLHGFIDKETGVARFGAKPYSDVR